MNESEKVLILGHLDITPLLKAQIAFEQAIEQAETQLECDGAIQRFEFTYELVWKTLRRILLFKGIEVITPRDIFRQAASMGLIDDLVVWFEFIKKRNLTSYTYNQDVAQDIFEELPKFKEELTKVVDKINAFTLRSDLVGERLEG